MFKELISCLQSFHFLDLHKQTNRLANGQDCET
jgi:hypothetical protein